jgi:biotin-(acetyl-CoA carboxylase) ligase
VDSIQFTLSTWETLRVDAINTYQNSLFCKDKIATFKTSSGSFEGRIVGVNEQGKLVVQQNNQVELAYDLKEIQLIY